MVHYLCHTSPIQDESISRVPKKTWKSIFREKCATKHESLDLLARSAIRGGAAGGEVENLSWKKHRRQDLWKQSGNETYNS